MRQLTYSQAIHEALHQAMEFDKSTICYGLGATDPKAIFGTTHGLEEKFGSDRVFDTPCSENAMTGIGIGAAINGTRTIMIHQRLDFFLLAMDQLVNNAAKWRYMFGGQHTVPITIRLILGKGWGQGPTHSQNLQSWFAHIPGLKVLMPTTPYDAKGLLLESIFDDNPVLFLEHRWLHNQVGEVPKDFYKLKMGKAKILREGNDITVITYSYMTAEALKASDLLKKETSIRPEIIDLSSIKPLDFQTIFESVKKTGRLLVLDTSHETCSISSEILAKVSTELFSFLKEAPKRLTLPDFPTPTSHYLTKDFYYNAKDIADIVIEMIANGSNLNFSNLTQKNYHDVPGEWFKGPF